MADIELENAMLCWNAGFNGSRPAFAVVRHPDSRGASDPYQSSVGACFSDWRGMSDRDRLLRLMVEAWHIVAFYEVPVELVRDGLLVIPEYRSTLADDCLPKQFRSERE